MVERARIILACMEGKEIQRVAHDIGTSIPTVSSSGGRVSPNMVLLASTTSHVPESLLLMALRSATAFWLCSNKRLPKDFFSFGMGRTRSGNLGCKSVHAVWRVLRKEGIYLQRLRTWCVSTDPECARGG